MAAVVAKNAVGSSWRKTLGSREWSRVPGALLLRCLVQHLCCDSQLLNGCFCQAIGVTASTSQHAMQHVHAAVLVLRRHRGWSE